MDERPPHAGPEALEGTDAAALGTTAQPEAAPSAAAVDASQRTVPGARFDQPNDSAKPWASSLSAVSHQAGVANEPADDDALQDGLEHAVEDDRDA